MRALIVFLLILTFPLSAAAQGDSSQTGEPETLKVDQSSESIKASESLAISEYQTNYFISGKPDTKIQLSFQFRLFTEYPVIFAYTQRMFWELYKESSSPFSDVNFMPEFFYRFGIDGDYLRNIESGYMHISNGESDPGSRTVDGVFARFNWGGRLVSSLNVKYYFSKETLNRDYSKYVGPFELQLQLKNIFKKYAPQDFYARIYTGGDFGEDLEKTSVELGMRYRFFGSDSSPGIFIQYFRGYAEKILTYNQLDESYRAGFSIGGDYRSR